MHTIPLFLGFSYSPPAEFLPTFFPSDDTLPSVIDEGLSGEELSLELPMVDLHIPPARRVSFAEGIEEPPTAAEGIALRREQRRREVQRARHAQLEAVWHEVMAYPLGDAERRVACLLIAAAIGLNHWPRLGSLLKWQPFQSRGSLERLGGSLRDCHRELWQEIESFVLMARPGRLGGTIWQWRPENAGPWVDLLEPWAGVDGFLASLFEETLILDQKRRNEGPDSDSFDMSEALLLTLSRELAPLQLEQSMQTWARCPHLVGQTTHPLLAGTVCAWHRAAAVTGELGWAEFFLGVLRGNPEDQGYVFRVVGTSVSVSPCEEAAAPGVARLASLAGPHAVDSAELDRAVAVLATRVFQRSQPPAEPEDLFWRGLKAIDVHGLIPQAVRALAAEEPRMLARMGRHFFSPTDSDHLDLARRLAALLAEALTQEQVERIHQSRLNPEQQCWLAQGFQAVAAAVSRDPNTLSPLLQFLYRQQMTLESLGDRAPSWQQAWDWRVELLAIETGKTLEDESGFEQVRGWLQELHRQLCVLWADTAQTELSASAAEALRRAEFMVRVEQFGETMAGQSFLNQGPIHGEVSLFSPVVSTNLGELSRDELASLKAYGIERLRGISAPRKLREALQDALALVTTAQSAQSILFEGEEPTAYSPFGGVEALRTLMKQCVLELVPRRIATGWASMAVSPANEPEVHHCVETIRIARRIFSSGLPLELSLRFARVLNRHEIAQRISPAVGGVLSSL